jgi:hypothetical protein
MLLVPILSSGENQSVWTRTKLPHCVRLNRVFGWRRRERIKTTDWLAEDAVSCELFSLLKGKNTGNLARSSR